MNSVGTFPFSEIWLIFRFAYFLFLHVAAWLRCARFFGRHTPAGDSCARDEKRGVDLLIDNYSSTVSIRNLYGGPFQPGKKKLTAYSVINDKNKRLKFSMLKRETVSHNLTFKVKAILQVQHHLTCGSNYCGWPQGNVLQSYACWTQSSNYMHQ